MASTIDFSALTFTAEQVRELNELLMLDYVKAEDFAKFHDVHDGIKADKEIGWLGQIGAIGKVSRGCNPADDTLSIPTVKKTWTPKEFDVRLSECYTDLASAMAVYARNNGTDVQDVSNTDYFNILLDRLGVGLQDFMWRLWLMDTDADTSNNSGGLIKIGTDLTLMRILDGYWKQIAAIIASDADRQTELAANEQSTKATQFSELTPEIAYTALQAGTYAISGELRQQPNKIGMITRYFADQVKKHLQTLSWHPESYNFAIDGIEVLKVNGIEFAIVDKMSEQILEYNDLGNTYHKPHRAIITTKENLAYGIEATNSFGYFKAFHDDTLRKSFVDLIDRIDVKIMQDKLIQVIY